MKGDWCTCKCICHIHNGKALKCRNGAGAGRAFCFTCISDKGCKRK